MRGDELVEAGVKKGERTEAAQADGRARNDSETQERATEQKVRDEHRPEDRERAAEYGDVRSERARYAIHPGGRWPMSTSIPRHLP